MKILFANNFPLDGLDRRCAAGDWPRHHLWGLDALRSAGHEVVLLPARGAKALRRLSRATRYQLGDLSTEWHAVAPLVGRDVDLVVCAEMGSMRGLGLARRARLLRTPLVGLLHPGIPSSPVARWSVESFDRVLCLSTRIADEVRTWRHRDPTGVVGWGPDLRFYDTLAGTGTHVVCNGRTNRDFEVLARACDGVDAPVVINGSAVVNGTAPEPIAGKPRPMEAIVDDLRRAAIVAIPLLRTDGCFGITEVSDAIGLGRPIVMTRNPFVDVDIEQIGCGRWVERGDTRGWRDAIVELMSDAALRASMGARGRDYADRHFNYELFCATLIEAVESAGGSSGAGRQG